jgi:hypothetical protein
LDSTLRGDQKGECPLATPLVLAGVEKVQALEVRAIARRFVEGKPRNDHVYEELEYKKPFCDKEENNR